MATDSLYNFCVLMADVCIRNATALRQKMTDLVASYYVDGDPEFILKTFVFMNYGFASGVWSNIQNTQLRSTLHVELKDAVIAKLAIQLAEPSSVKDVADKAAFLTKDFNAYIMGFTNNISRTGYANAKTARAFALDHIQQEYGIHDTVMNEIVPALFSDTEMNSEVEFVAMQANEAALSVKSKEGFMPDLDDAITPEEFIKTVSNFLGRAIDPESEFFFRHHPITSNLINRILSGKVKQTGDRKRDALVVQALVAEMTENTSGAASLDLSKPDLIANLVEEFGKTYPAASRMMAETFAHFFGLTK